MKSQDAICQSYRDVYICSLT